MTDSQALPPEATLTIRWAELTVWTWVVVACVSLVTVVLVVVTVWWWALLYPAIAAGKALHAYWRLAPEPPPLGHGSFDPIDYSDLFDYEDD